MGLFALPYFDAQTTSRTIISRPSCECSCGVNDYRKKKNNLTSTIMPGEIVKLLRVIFYFDVIIITSSFDD